MASFVKPEMKYLGRNSVSREAHEMQLPLCHQGFALSVSRFKYVLRCTTTCANFKFFFRKGCILKSESIDYLSVSLAGWLKAVY